MPHPTRWLLAAAGLSASVAFAPSAIAQEPTLPIIEPNVCVERLPAEDGAGEGGLRAHFWYDRFGGDALDIPHGPNNEVTPDGTVLVPFTPDEAVPTHFEPTGQFAFAVDLGVDPVQWTLRDEASGDGGTARADSGYAGRCIFAAFTREAGTDPVPFGNSVRFSWTAEVSGSSEFLEPDASGVPWSAWRNFHGNEHDPKCSLDGAAVACDQADVTLEDLAPGEHVFRVYAQPPLPEDVGPKAGATLHDGLFELRSTFTVAAPPPVEEPKPPVEEPKPPVEEPKPPVQEPKPQPPLQPQPPVEDLKPQLPVDPQPPVEPQPKSCVKRSATVTVPGARGQRYRSVKVTVDGKRVAVRRIKGRLVATVAPSRSGRATSTVKITIRLMSGKQRTFARSVRTCF